MALSSSPRFCIPSEGQFCRDCSWSGGACSWPCSNTSIYFSSVGLVCEKALRWPEGTCYNGECEGLHELEDIRAQQKNISVPIDEKVIIAAGGILSCQVSLCKLCLASLSSSGDLHASDRCSQQSQAHTSYRWTAQPRPRAIWQHLALQCNTSAVSRCAAATRPLLDLPPDRQPPTGPRCRHVSTSSVLQLAKLSVSPCNAGM